MKRSLRRPLPAALVLAAAMALSACSGDSGGTDAGGRTTIDVWLMRDSVTEDFQQRFIDDFHAKHPDIKVNVQIQ